MADPYLGEIRLFSWGMIPRGWAACNGQLLAISTNQALFSILGVSYGGNGTTTFGLPNLQGRTAISPVNTAGPGLLGGRAVHTLTNVEMPPHSHGAVGGSDATQTDPTGKFWGTNANRLQYTPDAPTGTANAGALGAAGQDQPHENRQPYLAMNYCIATTGLYPSRP